MPEFESKSKFMKNCNLSQSPSPESMYPNANQLL